MRSLSTTPRWRIRPFVLLAVAIFAVAFTVSPASAIAVMSIDLGSEWMKVAVVTPGVPMEIAMNPESKRKTSVVVTLRDGERLFGGDAINMGVKYPKSCYFYFLDLVGKKFDHPQIKLFRERFPYYDMKAHPERGTVLFQHDENTVYSPEELLAMVLEHAKRIASDFTEQKVKDAVIIVPAYFNQAERRAVLEAAKLAGVNCLQLISEPMAVSLNYGMFRRKEINDTVKHLMFYDMGAQDTTVSIVSFQIVKTKEKGFTETHPQAQVLGIGYERNLGGLNLNIKLRDYLAKKFNEMGKTKTDVTKVPRAMGKMLKEVNSQFYFIGRQKTFIMFRPN
jgi:hypoxia up-regulated 1